MNENEARELLKSAAGMPTYPISRALTHPATLTLGGVAAGNLAEALSGHGNTGVGALAGGAIGYLANKINRFIHARGLVSRVVSGPEFLMEGEMSAVRKAMGAKEAAARPVEPPFPWSETFTSRGVMGVATGGSALRSALRDGASGEEAALAAGIGAGVGGSVTALKRSIYARALKGRIETGGHGFTQTERDMVSGLRQGALEGKVIRGAKGAAIIAALGLGAYGAKKLLSKNEA
jgi:hypothetical protein